MPTATIDQQPRTADSRRHPRRDQGRTLRIAVAVLALLGVITLVYPSAARWFSDRRHAVEVTGYAAEVDQLPDATGRAILARAAEYNADLPTGPMRGLTLANGGASGGTTTGGYRDQLAVPGTDVMASLSIPAIGLDLPVRHGTDEATLGRGLGHLEGSSLPVGGAGTHSLITGHSGLVDASMFDHLHDLEAGDVVVVSVVGATLRYEIDSIETVTPASTEGLRIVPGEDRLTLVTCSPIGVNSHRLLVHAHRLADAPGTGSAQLGGTGIVAGFAWWAVAMAGGLAGSAVLAAPPRRRGRHRRGRDVRGAGRPDGDHRSSTSRRCSRVTTTTSSTPSSTV